MSAAPAQDAAGERCDLTIVIVTHDSRELVLTALASARAATGAIRCEWIVVDSGSSDGTPDAVAERWPDVELIRVSNVGFARANNLALRRATGRYVLLLNPDTAVLDGELSDLVAELDRRPGVGAAGVLHVDGAGRPLPSMMRSPSPLRQLGEALLPSAVRPPYLEEPVRPGRRYRRESAADWLSGAFLMLRSDALAGTGLLDERFFLFCEETDLCIRLHRTGWEVRHLPVMKIAHYGGSYTAPLLAAELCRSKLLYAEKHYRRSGRAVARTALALGHALRLAAAGARAGGPADRSRVRAEWAALRVALARSAPPRKIAYPPVVYTRDA